ncbi:MAG: LysR family transcriptional regulator [Paracoccaceae bacterium]|jgi:LysR family transcriptional regulator, glycine cleavage system transcriptional activator|nr:LysR family transcriptional regulator [Paracoccaceae bacterium]
MVVVSHLKALQALEMAIRVGSLKGAADELGITPAAVGQRIRSLEDFLETDLLMRGRSGLQPTADLRRTLSDLRMAFAALDRVTEQLDFQRVTEIHIVADGDWSELWFLPRLEKFRKQNQNILFCINGSGDVPMRLGAPDCRIEYSEIGKGEVLFRDRLLPVVSQDNVYRMAEDDGSITLEGMPLLHLEPQRDDPMHSGWIDWVEEFGYRTVGVDRGVHYRNARLALEAARKAVGFLVCGLSLVENDLSNGSLVHPFPIKDSIQAPLPYVLTVSSHGTIRPQLQRFCDWLRSEAEQTRISLEAAASSSD